VIESECPGYPEEQVETGAKFMKSYLGEKWYRVTKWVEKGGGKFIALEKEPVEKSEVPEEYLPDAEGDAE